MSQWLLEEALTAAVLLQENRAMGAESGESEAQRRHREIMAKYGAQS